MAGTRNLPPISERTPTQHIESGLRLDIAQKQTYERWDQQILAMKLAGRTPSEISKAVGCSEKHVRIRIRWLLEAAARSACSRHPHLALQAGD